MTDKEKLEFIEMFRKLPVEKQIAFYFMTQGAVFVNQHEAKTA